ncbi:hypothetical protein DFH09DRAFT_889879, partial [Mycena vulgaris]
QEQRATLAELKSQITRCKTYTDALENQQRKVESALSRLVHPVLTLPTEITSRIFVQCLPPHGRVHPSPSAGPLILAQIYRQWRDVALSSCQLWGSIYIHI